MRVLSFFDGRLRLSGPGVLLPGQVFRLEDERAGGVDVRPRAVGGFGCLQDAGQREERALGQAAFLFLFASISPSAIDWRCGC